MDLAVGQVFTTVLDNATRLRGQVLRPDGNPAGPAKLILVTSQASRHAPGQRFASLRLERRTDEHGAYDFPLEPGVYGV